MDNHANQCNPNQSEYRGYQRGYQGTGDRPDLNNHANQLNPTLGGPRVVTMSNSANPQQLGGRYQAGLDNHSDQCNPNNLKYEGHQKGYTGIGSKPDLNNHGEQLNPNNWKFQGPK